MMDDLIREPASDSCLRLMIHQSRHAMVRLDASGRIQWANEGLVQITGASLEDLHGRVLLTVLAGGQQPSQALVDAQIRMGAGMAYLGPVPCHRRDGSPCCLDLDLRPLAHGQAGFVATAVDITEARTSASHFRDEAQFETLMSAMLETEVDDRRRAEEALRTSEERYRSAMEHVQEIGGRIQRSLLAGQPVKTFGHAQVAMLSIPSQQVDGDFSDFEATPEALEILVGDVMGKGIPAALLGAATKNQFLRAKAALLSRAGTLRPDPGDIVNRVHRSLTPQFIRLESFVTVVLARFDAADHRLRYVNAGHTRPIHRVARTGEIRTLPGDNVPLGFLPDEVYVEQAVAYEPGDVFVFYSDGVTEARDAGDALFGEERLIEVVRREGHRYPQHLLAAIQDAVMSFAGSEIVADDLTCVVVRVDDDPGPILRSTSVAVPGRLDALVDLRTFLRGFVESCGTPPPLDPDALAEVLLAVTEAASNVIRHAFEGRPGCGFQVRAALHRDRLRLELSHDGVPLDPESIVPPSLDGSRESGFGLFIIEAAMDEVRYTRDAAGRSLVRLSKFRTDLAGGLPIRPL
jgi:PAS domain S-box-containing protein